jgi:hypothetical protein
VNCRCGTIRHERMSIGETISSRALTGPFALNTPRQDVTRCINSIKMNCNASLRRLRHSWTTGSSVGTESSLHQLAPYIGKLKTSLARNLISEFSRPGQIIFDPFSGSGVVPLESLLLGRGTIANDLNPYAATLTRAKIHAPIRREGDHDVVKATVCLPELPIAWWPSKIEEYEDVLRWINSQSKTEFVIDYQERAWKMQRNRRRPRNRRRHR